MKKENNSSGQKLFKNKGLILAIVLPLGFWIFIFSFWFFNKSNPTSAGPIIINKTENEFAGQTTLSQLASANASLDSDKDGLSDWEESIYGTDIKQKDSDGDGYLDGEEIVSGRHPLKKGPDDFIENQDSNQNSKSQRTATEKFVEIAMGNYLKTFEEKSPAEFKPEEVNRILKDSLESDPEISAKFNEILKSELYFFVPADLDKEIKISKDTEKNQESYWQNMSKLLMEMQKTEPRDDFFQAISQSMRTRNYSKTDEFGAFYQKMYAKAQKMSVPASLASNHKDLMTFLYKMQKISESIKEYETDPIKTLLALNELSEITQKTFNKK